MPKNVVLQLKGATADRWYLVNPTLASREIGFVLDNTDKVIAFKVGDGKTRWNNLDYFVPGIDQINSLSEALESIKDEVSVTQSALADEINRSKETEAQLFESINTNVSAAGIFNRNADIDIRSLNGNYNVFVDHDFIRIGSTSSQVTPESVAVGKGISITQNNPNSYKNTAIGEYTKIVDTAQTPVSGAVALGTEAQVYAQDAVQLGRGRNSTKDSLKFRDTLIVLPNDEKTAIVLATPLLYQSLLELENLTDVSALDGFNIIPVAVPLADKAKTASVAISADSLSEKGFEKVTEEIDKAISNQRMEIDDYRENVTVGTNSISASNAWGTTSLGYATQIGQNVIRSTALGYGAKIRIPKNLESKYALADGELPSEKNYFNAVQLGEGTNQTPNSLQFFNAPVIIAQNTADPTTYKIDKNLLDQSLNGATLLNFTAGSAIVAETAENAKLLDGVTLDWILNRPVPYYNYDSINSSQLGTGTNPTVNQRIVGTTNIGNNTIANDYTDIQNVIAVGQKNIVDEDALKGGIVVGVGASIKGRDSIQLGTGSNGVDKSLQVFDCQVLYYNSETGKYYFNTGLLQNSIDLIPRITINDANLNNIKYSTLSVIPGGTGTISANTLTVPQINTNTITFKNAQFSGNVLKTLNNYNFEIEGGTTKEPLAHAGAWSSLTNNTVIRYADLVKYLDTNPIPEANNARELGQTPNIRVGRGANASNNSVAIGPYSVATGLNSIAIGGRDGDRSTSPAAAATGNKAIQLGFGTNPNRNSLKVFDTLVIYEKPDGKKALNRDLIFNGADCTDLGPVSSTEKILEVKSRAAENADKFGGFTPDQFMGEYNASIPISGEIIKTAHEQEHKAAVGSLAAGSLVNPAFRDFGGAENTIRIGYRQVGHINDENTIAIGSNVATHGQFDSIIIGTSSTLYDDYDPDRINSRGLSKILIGTNSDLSGTNAIVLGSNLSLNNARNAFIVDYANTNFSADLDGVSNIVQLGVLSSGIGKVESNSLRFLDQPIVTKRERQYFVSGAISADTWEEFMDLVQPGSTQLVSSDYIEIEPYYEIPAKLLADSLPHVKVFVDENSIKVGDNINVGAEDEVSAVDSNIIIGFNDSAFPELSSIIIGSNNYPLQTAYNSIIIGNTVESIGPNSIAIGTNIPYVSGDGTIVSGYFSVFGSRIIDGLGTINPILNSDFARRSLYNLSQNSQWMRTDELSDLTTLAAINRDPIISGTYVDGAWASKYALSAYEASSSLCAEYARNVDYSYNSRRSDGALAILFSQSFDASGNLIDETFEPLSSIVEMLNAPIYPKANILDIENSVTAINTFIVGYNNDISADLDSINSVIVGSNNSYNPSTINSNILIGSGNSFDVSDNVLANNIIIANGVRGGSSTNSIIQVADSTDTPVSSKNSIVLATELNNSANNLENGIYIGNSPDIGLETGKNHISIRVTPDESSNENDGGIFIGGASVPGNPKTSPVNVIAIGDRVSAVKNSIQLGSGSNQTPASMNVYNTQLLSAEIDENGSIETAKNWKINDELLSIKTDDKTYIRVGRTSEIASVGDRPSPLDGIIVIGNSAKAYANYGDNVVYTSTPNLIAIGDNATICNTQIDYDVPALGGGNVIQLGEGDAIENIIALSSEIEAWLQEDQSSSRQETIQDKIPNRTTNIFSVFGCPILYKNRIPGTDEEKYFINPLILRESLPLIDIGNVVKVESSHTSDSATAASSLIYERNNGEITTASYRDIIEKLGVVVNKDLGVSSITIGQSVSSVEDRGISKTLENSLILATMDLSAEMLSEQNKAHNFIQLGNPDDNQDIENDTVRIFNQTLMKKDSESNLWKIPRELYDAGAYSDGNVLWMGLYGDLSSTISYLSGEAADTVKAGGIIIGNTINFHDLTSNITMTGYNLSGGIDEYLIAIGGGVDAANSSIAIGRNVKTGSAGAIAIGANSGGDVGATLTIAAGQNDIAIGTDAKTFEAGESIDRPGGNRIQIGSGTNTRDGTVQFGKTTVLIGDGEGNYQVNPNIIAAVQVIEQDETSLTIVDNGQFREILGKESIPANSPKTINVIIHGINANDAFDVNEASLEEAINRINVQATLVANTARNHGGELQVPVLDPIFPIVYNVDCVKSALDPTLYDLVFNVSLQGSTSAIKGSYKLNYSVKFLKSDFSKDFSVTQ